MIRGPIRVLELIHNSGITGPGRIVYGLAKYIDKKAFSLDVCCPVPGYLPRELEKIGVRVVPFAAGNLLRLRSYHVLHIHSGQLNAQGRILGRLGGVPAVIYTEHLTAEDHEWIKNKAALSLHLFLHRLSNACIDRVIAVSDVVRRSYIKRQNISPEKIACIYNGIDVDEIRTHTPDRGKFRLSYGIALDVPVVGIIGRLVPEKGHEDFIMAAREVLKINPKVKFLIVGVGRERQHLEALAKNLGLGPDLFFTGFQENIFEVIDALDVLVQSSLNKRESFGLSVVEAMARQKAVIVSSAECFKEIVEDGFDGLIYPSGDFKQLAAKILRLLGDERLRAELGRAAGVKAEKFDLRIMVKKCEDLYRETLRAKGFLK